MSLRAQFIAFDDRLAALGVPPLTAWWRDGIGAWLDAYEAGGPLELFACVGRGAAKSTVVYKLAVFFSLFGAATVPPGERHFAIVLSRLKEEASKGIAIIAAWLRLLRVPHRVAGDVIELEGMPRGIRVVAASVAATSGWRAFFVGRDERSKWPSGGELGLDADEIDTSAAAMTTTHPRAPSVAVGSAWRAAGTWHETVMCGTTDRVHVLGPAPTWVAAPHVTEADTRAKERDPRRWAREYACVADAGASSALDVDALRACVREPPPGAELLAEPEIVIDASGGRNDAFVVAVVAWVAEPSDEAPELWLDLRDDRGALVAARAVLVRDERGRPRPNPAWHPPAPRLAVLEIHAWEGALAERMSTGDVADAIARIAGRHGARRVHGDQFGAWSWTSDLRARGLSFAPHPWTASSKTDAVLRLRQLVRERSLIVAPSDEAHALVREAAAFEEVILPSGALTFRGRGSAHDDRIMTLLLAARVDAEGGLRGSPLAQSARRFEVYDYADAYLDPDEEY